MCITNGKFKFLDVSNFVAPGFSYDKFIKAYEIEMHKSFFPTKFVPLLKTSEHAIKDTTGL